MADSKYNLASLHKKRRETEKARQLFLECEQTYSAVYGPDHSETQDAARQLVNVYSNTRILRNHECA